MTTITQENVRFNGTLDNAAVLKVDGANKTLILTDNLSDMDKTRLDAFIAQYGSNPLAAAVAGSASAHYKQTVVGADATGLDSVAASTAGTLTVNLGGGKVAGSASGLSSSVGTAGYQVVNLAPGISGASATGLNGGSAATAGYQSIAWTDLIGANATGLANDATAYTATITIDGVASPVSVTGSAAQTFTDLITAINADITGKGTATIASSTELRVTSATTGATSTVLIADGTLLAALTGAGSIAPAVAGLAATAAVTYTASVSVDGVAKAISISGAAAQTYATLINELNTDLGASAVASLSGGDLKITSASFGLTSAVVITAGTLFTSLPAVQGIFPAAGGDDTSRKYSAVFTIDGTNQVSVQFAGITGTTIGDVIAELNTDLGAAATAALDVNGNLTITSSTTGAKSSVAVADTGVLFCSLTGYAGFTSVSGVEPRTYTLSAEVDGVAKEVSISGSDAQTFTTLLAELNAVFGAGSVVIDGKQITFKGTTGNASSTVKIVKDDLLRHTTGFVNFTTTAGASDLVAAMKAVYMGAGSVFDQFRVITVGAKPPVANASALPKTPEYTYFDGTNWLYLKDDTAVN